MSFLGCFMHGVKLSSWPGLPTEANSYRDTCYLLWESFASVWWLRELKGAERVLERFRGVCVFKARAPSRLTQGGLQKGMVLGPCHRLHLNNEEGHFLLFFLLPLHFLDTFYSELWICNLLFWLNNCVGGQGTEAETSWSFHTSNLLS